MEAWGAAPPCVGARGGPGGGAPPGPCWCLGAGYSLVECLFVITLVVIIAGATAPPLMTGLERSRAYAAARFVHGRLMLARAQAGARGATVAVQVAGTPERAVLTTIVDGNRNGVRMTDVTDGVDIRDTTITPLQSAFRGVRLEPITAEGVLFSFSPLGTSSSGTFYITGQDGSRFAVRVLGATGRARVLRHLAASDSWTDVE